MQSFEMVFACKKCRKVFRKDAQQFEESDEYCPHCDNHFVIEAKTPKAPSPSRATMFALTTRCSRTSEQGNRN